MKILLLGDASNYHATLAGALVRAGHNVTVASHGNYWMNTHRDIDTSRGRSRIGGLWLWAKLNTLLRSRLRGYDVVQIAGPNFVELKPKRLRPIFDRLRHDNGAVFMSHLGFDSRYIRALTSPNPPLRYSELHVGDRPAPLVAGDLDFVQRWLDPELADYQEYVYEHIDGVITCIYEYMRVCRDYVPSEKLGYAGIPIDLSTNTFHPIDDIDGPVRFMLACHRNRRAEKGADILLDSIRRVMAERPGRAELQIVENVPIDRFMPMLDSAHIVVDQLYSYTPSTTPLLAMARGRVAITGAEPEAAPAGGWGTGIINPSPLDLEPFEQQLRDILDHPERLHEMTRDARRLVERENDADIVARRFTDFWQSHL